MKQGWEKQYFENCFKLKSGDNLTSKNMSENGNYPVFGGNGIAGYHNEFNVSGSNVIIGRVGALCGNVRHLTENIWLTDNAFRIVDFKFDFDHSFLTYLLNYKDLRSYARQAAQPVISNSSLKDVVLQFPKSLKEQQHIVSILDEAFAAIAKAKANAEQNLKNAKELLEVFLHKYFTNKEEGWEVKRLKDVADYFNGLTYSPKDVNDKGIIVLRSSNIQNDKLDFSDIVRVNVSVKDKIIVKDGDILMCSRNGSKRLVGKTAPIEKLPEQMTFGTFMMIVRSNYNPYLLWFFKSLDFKKQISGGENTMINQITRYMLDDIVVSFPPIEKQMEIVKQLDAIYNESQKLESIYLKKIDDLEELKKSVLQKAFAGELKTENNIAL